jgi:hypothetical protein
MNLKKIALFLIFFIPLIGRFVDFPETSFFYGISIFLFVLTLVKKTKIRLHPKILIVELILTILFFISVLYSKNTGTSINYLFIFITSIFILNLLFVNFSKTEIENFFIFFSAIYSVVFLLDKTPLLSLQEDIRRGDNFILQVWGHSNLSDFIVLCIPIIIFRLKSKKYIQYLIFGLLLISLFLTQSRSSLIVLAIGLIFLRKNKLKSIPSLKTKLAVIFITVIMIFSITSTASLNSKSVINDRLELWRQSLIGFTKSPLFGNGSGTFSLINRRYEEGNKLTFFPHSSLLGSLYEHGIFFTSLSLIIIIIALCTSFKRNNLYFVISIIAILNSLLDATWSSPGILIISLYFIFYESVKQINLKNTKSCSFYHFSIFLIIAFVFLQDIVSQTLFHFKEYEKSILINPFNLTIRKVILTDPNVKSELWQKNLNLVLKYFPNEPTVYISLINSQKLPESKNFYIKLIDLLPKDNDKYLFELSQYFIKNNYQDELINVLDSHLIGKNKKISDHSKAFTAIFYQLALYLFDKDPVKSINYLKEATIYSPYSTFLRVDLANAYWHAGLKDEAIKQIQFCNMYLYFSDHCSTYLNQHRNTDFELPGGFINQFQF